MRWSLVLLIVGLGCGPATGGPEPGPGPGPGPGVDSGAIYYPDSGTQPPITPPPGPGTCNSTPGSDTDGDGWPAGSDCNDCTPQINPGAYDAPGNGIDEDCNGVDETAASACDVGLPVTPPSANEAAMAMGLCKFVAETESGWGVLSARFTNASGTGNPASMEQVGTIAQFGTITPPQGGAILALSSGTARDPSQPGFTSQCDHFGVDDGGDWGPPGGGGEAPPPVTVSSPSCPGGGGRGNTEIYNSVALEVRVRAPSNAIGFSFNSNFFTYEYPEFICDEFNDYFSVMRLNAAGGWDNIVFDTEGNAVSVNNGLLQVCTPGTHGGKTFACTLGRDQLTSTGYDGTAQCGMEGMGGWGGPGGPGGGGPAGAATGWLRTVAPVTGGEIITLRFAIWDTGDPDLDSLALIDGFEWEVEGAVVPPTPMTQPDLI